MPLRVINYDGASYRSQLLKSGSGNYYPEYIPTDMELKHVDEVLKLLAVFGEADKFAELVRTGESKEVKTMCQAVDRIEERGIEKGIERGIEKGIISLVEAMQELGQTNEAILQMVMKKFSLTEEKAKTYL